MSITNQDLPGRAASRPASARMANLSLAKAIAIAAGISLIGLLIAFQADAKSELHKQLMSASLALLFGACFGGIVKMLLDQAVAEKRRRDDAALFVANALANLKKVYDHVERARLLIPAHQSAKTWRRDAVHAGRAAALDEVHPAAGHRQRGTEKSACRVNRTPAEWLTARASGSQMNFDPSKALRRAHAQLIGHRQAEYSLRSPGGISGGTPVTKASYPRQNKTAIAPSPTPPPPTRRPPWQL